MVTKQAFNQTMDAFPPMEAGRLNEDCPDEIASQVVALRPDKKIGEEICLARGGLLRLEGDHRLERIEVSRGVIWVTQPGDPDDHLLCAGEALVLSKPGLVVAQGIAPATITIAREG